MEASLLALAKSIYYCCRLHSGAWMRSVQRLYSLIIRFSIGNRGEEVLCGVCLLLFLPKTHDT